MNLEGSQRISTTPMKLEVSPHLSFARHIGYTQFQGNNYMDSDTHYTYHIRPCKYHLLVF
jgi:hypothetical protein